MYSNILGLWRVILTSLTFNIKLFEIEVKIKGKQSQTEVHQQIFLPRCKGLCCSNIVKLFVRQSSHLNIPQVAKLEYSL